MCGIAGIISINPSKISRERLQKMTRAIAHRGPDGESFWINPSGVTGLGHRRLAIIDLNETGAQPMSYAGRYTIIHNGEIYNYLELRADLQKKGYRFRSQSDTEVILAMYDEYKEECLQYFDGMFAFTIWDEKLQTLFCARDRFGEKPFYYYLDDEQFLFASERKALWSAGVEKKINKPLLLNYLALGLSSTAADSTITFHQDIFSLPPSHYLTIHAPSLTFTMHRYWDGDKQTQINISESDAINKFNELFLQSVNRRLRSDVTIGCSVSGGLDSSGIVSAISRFRNGMGSLATFSAVFPGFEKDESRYIDRVSSNFNVNSHKIIPTAEDFIQNFEKLCYHQEEPFTSSSIYAQYKVFEAAGKNGIKVLLDGQGADETLSGYTKYIPWYLQELLRKNPRTFFHELHAFKKQNIPFKWSWRNYLAAFFPLQVPSYLQRQEAKKIMHQRDLTDAFKTACFDSQSIYKPLVTKLNDILYFSTYQFGLEELLRVADRNAMAHGRELRLPFLNHELVAFSASLPSHFKMHEGWTKWILRKCMADHLPAEIVWRKDKTGYEPPQKKWMGEPLLQEYVYEAKKKLIDEKILKPGASDKKNQPLDAHAADNYDWRYLVASAFI